MSNLQIDQYEWVIPGVQNTRLDQGVFLVHRRIHAPARPSLSSLRIGQYEWVLPRVQNARLDPAVFLFCRRTRGIACAFPCVSINALYPLERFQGSGVEFPVRV